MAAVVTEASNLLCLQLDSNLRTRLCGLTVMNHSICANREGKYVTFLWPLRPCVHYSAGTVTKSLDPIQMLQQVNLNSALGWKFNAYGVYACWRITSDFAQIKDYNDQWRSIWKGMGNGSATVLPLTLDSSNRTIIMWTDFSDWLFRFCVIYERIYWCFSDGPSQWLLS